MTAATSGSSADARHRATANRPMVHAQHVLHGERILAAVMAGREVIRVTPSVTVEVEFQHGRAAEALKALDAAVEDVKQQIAQTVDDDA